MKDTTYYTHYKGEYIQALTVEEGVKSLLSRIEFSVYKLVNLQ